MPRLYLQRGLSNRVARAVSQRLERFLAMSSSADRTDGAADLMDGADARTRSRSPVRAANAEANGLDGTVNVPIAPGSSVPEGTIHIPDETPVAPGGTGGVPGLDAVPPGLDAIPPGLAMNPPGLDVIATDPAEPEVWRSVPEVPEKA